MLNRKERVQADEIEKSTKTSKEERLHQTGKYKCKLSTSLYYCIRLKQFKNTRVRNQRGNSSRTLE